MIKWGIIGPGAIAHKFANEIDNTEKGKLISAYGRNEEKVKNFAKEYDLSTYYTNLDEFLKLLQLLPKKSDENIIKDFKERFKKDYDETSEALEWHIETLVNFGGDSTHKIYKAMIEVINDIINDAPSTDKDGMIEYLQEMI